MKHVSFLRHSGWVSPKDLTAPVHIVGCGAVGSNFAVTAAKMGFTNFHLWDNDIVESHNLPNQAFDVEHIGLRKTTALEAVLKRFNPMVNVNTHEMYLTKEHKHIVQGIMVIATDSMSSRSEFVDIFKFNPMIQLVVECRLGFDFGECNVVNPMVMSDINNFTNSLRDDSEVPEGPCNQRICTTLVHIVSSAAVHQLCSFFVARRDNTEWSTSKKTMFTLNSNVQTYSI